jgi:hypothetical protein
MEENIMNLLAKENWLNELPWGTSITPFIMNSIPEMVNWKPDGSVEFGVIKAQRIEGWIRDDDWNKISHETIYGNGMIVSKEEFGLGVFTAVVRLPRFRGSWPGWWFINLKKLPPEFDAFEQFLKDGFLSRFHVTTTYNDGPTYENNYNISKVKRFWYPVDWKDITIHYVRQQNYISLAIDHKLVMEINRSSYPNFPNDPMNIVFNSGVGPWNPNIKRFSPVILKSMTYEK